ncbi:MAG: M23 family metallopeptidase [Peptococcaceae bacterium]|jgi:murein DD-endopeptidase MepM/ murein hydrolase activator NlpD|nr:M23 family metallopeptidase [Peptococcaceae bacterium]
MKRADKRFSRSGSLKQLVIISLCLIAIAFGIWKLFAYQQDSTAADYELLMTIPPEEIISIQKNRSESWQDYLALQQAVKIFTKTGKGKVEERGEIEEALKALQVQLDRNTDFKNLDWGIVPKDIKKIAGQIRKILDQYPVYQPGRYEFPLPRSCYYEDTFGADREGGRRTHQGTDLFDIKGTKIFNVCSGTVEKLGWNRLGGERVGIRGEDGNYYYYAHLDEINPQLWVGKKISKGELIGTMGNTGDAITTPDHLHFGIELPNGEWLNPYPFLKVWEFHKFELTGE